MTAPQFDPWPPLGLTVADLGARLPFNAAVKFWELFGVAPAHVHWCPPGRYLAWPVPSVAAQQAAQAEPAAELLAAAPELLALVTHGDAAAAQAAARVVRAAAETQLAFL